MLADGVITEAEYEEAHQQWLACIHEVYPTETGRLADRPEATRLTVKLQRQPDGLYGFSVLPWGTPNHEVPPEFDGIFRWRPQTIWLPTKRRLILFCRRHADNGRLPVGPGRGRIAGEDVLPGTGARREVMSLLRRLATLVLAFAWTVTLAAPAAAGGVTAAADGAVLRAKVQQTITPVVADHIVDGVEQAERDGYAAYLVELDTPGGLDTSMREIVQSFLDSRVPVIVYVSPAGARAASAGAIITFASHVAAMAPATTIGAATPVNAETGETASDKVINDAAAYAESVAAQQGRDTQFAVDAVREGRAVTANEALEIGVVDLVARDTTELLAAADGLTVTAGGREVVLATAGAEVVEYNFGVIRSLLQVLANPNLAFLFLSIGTLALIYELATPGMGLGGVIGAIMLILAFFALSVLPVNIAGLLLMALAAGLFVAELFAPGVGVFAGGGTIALLFAGLFLFEGQLGVNPVLLWPTAVLLGVGVVIAGRLALRARLSQPSSGPEAFTGRQLVLRQASGTSGRALLEGAWWTVHSRGQPLREGQPVRVVGVDGLTLLVEPADNDPNENSEGTNP